MIGIWKVDPCVLRTSRLIPLHSLIFLRVGIVLLLGFPFHCPILLLLLSLSISFPTYAPSFCLPPYTLLKHFDPIQCYDNWYSLVVFTILQMDSFPYKVDKLYFIAIITITETISTLLSTISHRP